MLSSSALADIGGVWPIEEVTRALTDFADASVRGAVDVVLAEAAAARADPPCRTPKTRPPAPASSILALGKHGAGELNYSSDIDLVVFFDSASAPLADGVEPTTFYTRVAQRARAAPAGAHAGRLRASGRLSAAPRSGLDADRGVARFRLHLLRDGRPELGARRAHQGAPDRWRRRARRALPSGSHAVHLAQVFRLRLDRRRARHEAADPCRARARPDRGRRARHQARPRRHPRDRVLRADAAARLRRTAAGPARAPHARDAAGPARRGLDHCEGAGRALGRLPLPALGRAPAADGRRRADAAPAFRSRGARSASPNSAASRT